MESGADPGEGKTRTIGRREDEVKNGKEGAETAMRSAAQQQQQQQRHQQAVVRPLFPCLIVSFVVDVDRVFFCAAAAQTPQTRAHTHTRAQRGAWDSVPVHPPLPPPGADHSMRRRGGQGAEHKTKVKPGVGATAGDDGEEEREEKCRTAAS